jgi:hypothetical protein
LPMSVSLNHYVNVLKFWRSVETFTLPDTPAKKRNDNKIHTQLMPGRPLPWEPGRFAAPKEGKKWKHTLYFHVVAKEAVVDLLARLSGSMEFRDPIGGLTCGSALVLDQMGQPAERTYSPAAFIYGIKIIREKMDPDELTELLKKAQEDYLLRFQVEKEKRQEEDEPPELNMVNWTVLEKELGYLRTLVRNELTVSQPVLCISETVATTVNLDAPFLNSYFVADLNNLINHPNDIGRPLEIYLTAQADLNSRYNLLQPAMLLQSLHPRNQSPGRWPSNPTNGLYSAQQAALHLALPALRQKSGLLGINGPPGTGKTTLLREVVADVVVTRAKRLLRANVSELFIGKWQKIVDMLGYYMIDSSVFSNDGIVVSSNNNTAVENISKELPVFRSIDREAFNNPEYFSVLASSIREEPCWAMLSAVLGKSENRSNFINKFWFNSGRGLGAYLKLQYEDPVQSKKNAEKYEQTAARLKDLLEQYDEFNAEAGEYHDTLCYYLANGKDDRQQSEWLEGRAYQLKYKYGIQPGNLPDLRFLDLSVEEIHRQSPYSSLKINTLRSEIFLRSLELQELAILVNAKYFRSNLNAFVNMVSNKHADLIDGNITAILWRTFFFCIPVVSVTLASFQRQFAKMGQGSIGWLLLDEAGQATTPSVCGAIWRSNRCILIGDTLQIPPVVTIPKGLGKMLQGIYKITDECWSPVYHSAQFLADRVTAPGTFIDQGGGAETWTGIPLRAHRRCSEPMFSISNSIAYSGQMVKVTKDKLSDIPTGKSGWIDVQIGTSQEGHAITEELQVLDELLQQLTYYNGKIYVISPFRAVGDICKTKYYQLKDKIECGTIHTFQGKEAEIVFLVLGTLPGSVGARDWVADTPNMLNVAVTRAKERLYVIGNRKVWAKHRYFDYLAEKLPVKEHFSGRLF